MQPEQNDRDIQELFREMREADRRKAPPFHRVWQRVVSSREAARRPRPAWGIAVASGAAAMGVLAVLLFLGPFSQREPGSPAMTEVSLSEWRSPTEFLLEYPGQDLFLGMPELGEPAEPYSGIEGV